ncbi:ABC transporter permease [Halalkalibacterium halodurans]|uniref:Ferrichrome ABC transporter (Permease) n=1 Tax=Halalkalibacterium halodurans (strain ATCC BAA-125 / DSM 18197 / FERM 7344 / JCM 9153 / C-125) TaxID=272558 RepID=Q9KE33_HALH5|nr:ABC transporter permease [Halalkalibacterium halodurans]MDY7221561.1 ABC transporter permease [Halalkalibacterium halodurans]MDY7240837.1 ABC transporter permease [Halalkalibacterium halodurans]MED4080492.1 ABC transporter permease [Halalkalibacterium halodurans]MED4086495.1 ABC transporter permease [Halalkalibacterium halodurans]MED4104796.1 ABC transporter permease [Halalkalibacterium halodurans]
MKKRYLLPVLLLSSICSLFIGVSEVTLSGLLRMDGGQWQILFTSRLPRLMSILIAGIGMSVCGLIMQQLTRNRFVSPTTAGTLDSARLGILVSMILFTSAGPIEKIFVAFLFALAGTFIFMMLLERIKFKDPIFIPLVGLMFGSIISSITTFFAYRYDLIQNMSAWLQGNFALMIKGQYELLYISIPVLILAYVFANRFTVAGMGEEFAVNLGLKYKQVVNIGLVIVALVTSVVVLTVGMIPFLGLIIPNIVSIYKGDNLRKNLPYTALLGALFVLLCDIIGRVIIYPYEIAIGLTVGVIGSAIFLYMLLRRHKYGF